MVLVGSNLPHYWKYDDDVEQWTDDVPYSTVIHFFDNFWGNDFLELPENKLIKVTLKAARLGLQIIGGTQEHTANAMQTILISEGPKRIIMLMEALMTIGNCTEKKTLSSLGFSHNFEEADKDRINSIYDYSFANFKSRISLEEIAGIANLSQNSFCRYFKSKTQKTYSRFITEIRVGYACKLLIEDNFNMKQICYESGFNNFSSFHTAFKSVTNKTPLSYQHKFLLMSAEVKSKIHQVL